MRRLLLDPDYQLCLRENEKREVDRHYCRHDFNHLLDVARIAWILCLERGCAYPQGVVYAAALLHDIGRFMQYDDPSKDHAVVSCDLAEPLLARQGCSKEQINLITTAILVHRLPPADIHHPLGRIIAEADDLSRRCFQCTALAVCHKYERMATKYGVQY